MQRSFEQLFKSTGDLLQHVHTYDKYSIYKETLMAMDETYRVIQKAQWLQDSELFRQWTINRLRRMEYKLLTILEGFTYHLRERQGSLT
ncbi:hypothetical protein [Paenibacillus spongiae]|uniref:Four helix bundle protein n=1 Tax=Paenibacillus spongiae TaxID=2909671 RepID=A0ABY5SE27_9BACL|nr:hypothetical protein [Paenibacillus spongiae]UVI32222.1 hypothetical protein L1F29_10560 [Paenibacillus spongiae]